MNSVQILVLDFGSQYTQLIARRLREYGIYAEIVPYFESIDSIIAKNPKGIILSGGPASVYDEGAYKPDSRIFELGLPILGICYGMQYIAHFFGGRVVRALSQEFGRAVLTILNKDSVSPTQILQTNHFIIRTFTTHDFKSLCELLSNEEAMQKSPTINEQMAKKWLNEQIANYQQRGYGMWAVIDKENGKMIGYAGFEKTKLKSNNAAQPLETKITKDSIKEQSMTQDSRHSKIMESCAAKSRETFAKDSVIEVLQWNHIIDRSYQNSDSEEIANACFSYAFQNLYVNEIYLLANKDNKMMRHIAQTFGAVQCSNDEVIVWKINNSLESARNSDKKIIGDDLILRELVSDDLSDIESMLLDCEVMSAWGRTLSKEEAKEWLSKQMQSYKLYGFGLFAVIEKSSGIMVGQCGITWQNVQDSELYNTIKSSISANDYLTQNNVEALLESKSPLLPELGYIFKKSYWHKGLANKAAQMCMDYAFQTLGLPLLISLIKTDNIAPQNVAKRLEMHIVGKTYKTFDGAYIPHFVYVMRASDYLGLNFKSPELKKVLLEFESFAPRDSTDNAFNSASNSTQNNLMTSEVKLEILKIWRDSINATHHFLTQSDIESMENDIVQLLESTTVVIVSDYDKKIGFISLRGNKVEAIFVSPSAFKRGIGKELLKKALESSLGDYDEIFVDCNEANADAISFYHSLGFEIFSRSSKDLQNRNLPLVHFRAKSLSLMREFDLHYNLPIFETDRLIVREMRQSDKGQLQTMLLDYEVMSSWEYNFNDSSVQEWLEVQIDRYEKFGFGLWAVVEKDSGQMIGQAGLSLQTYNGEKVLGMTYIIARKHWKKGYGAEVALGCKHYAFQVLKVRELYLLINESNEASKSVAKKLQAHLLGDTTWTYRSRSLRRLVYRIKNENVCKFSLETSRTTLRPYLDSDYPVLKEMLQDGETMKAWSGALSERGVHEWIAKEQTNHDKFGIGWWVVVDRANGVVVGLTGLHYTQYLDTKYLEMRYMLHKNHWHKGYAIEVVLACKEYAFRHLRAKRLYSICREDNLAAQNVAQRVGMDRVGTTERDGINYVEFCAVSKVNPLSYTKYIYTSMESLETLQKKIGALGLRINALNIADSKEVLDLSSLWQEHFRRTHAHIPQEVVEQSGKNMQAMIKQSRQCLTISCERQGVVENELLGFLILHDMDSSHSFIEIFLCTQKALMQKEGAILLQAFIHMNDSKYITIPVITTQEQRHFYENLGFTQQQDSEDIPHFAGTLPSNVVSSLYYRYHGTELPCFIYGMERMALSASLRSFLSKDKHFDLAEKDFSQSGDKQITPRVETLFDNVGQDSIVWMSHADKVEVIPQGFVELAKSDNTHYCAIANFERQIYALQFHPEVVHSECGGEILKNFALRICGADNSWNMKNFASLEIAKLRKKVLGCEFSDLESKMDFLSESLGNTESRADIKGDTLLDSRSSGEEVLRNEKDCVSSRASSASETDSCVSLSNTESRVREDSKTGGVTGFDTREDSKADSAAGFCDDFVGCDDFEMRSLLDINDEVAKSNSHKSAQKPTQKVLCAVSGGVDSSVVATLLYRAIGENLIPVFVDTGLLRKGEREAVEMMFRENLKVPLIVVDASRLFLSRLKGVLDPEKKRKIIGETFIEVFEAEAKKHNTQGEIKFLAQGTLYPDVIESVSVKGPSKTIKSHHNVGGLPEWMKFELIEPLRELFKDEVRALGRELGMPESMLMRHPFPGPGLAIRIMGEVNEGDLGLLREADSIFIEELQKSGLYNSVWQAFCVLLNVKSVGVMGDNRTYDNTICLRAVEALDGMTASFSHLPHNFLESVSNRIINEVAGINRVVYDITSKPPGTIEWE